MNNMAALVVDDEPLARRRMIRMLNKLGWITRVDEAANILQARELIDAHKPQILLLDIQMPGGSGFELLNDLSPPLPAIVFVTAFDHYALRAFEAQAVDYVTKPIEPGRFSLALERARDAALASDRTDQIAELKESLATLKKALGEKFQGAQEFWVKAKGQYLRIPPEQIIRFEADGDYVNMYLDGACYTYPEGMASIERRLDPVDFWRIHRSMIVRRTAIMRVRQASFGALILILSDGAEVRVGRTYLPKIRAALNR